MIVGELVHEANCLMGDTCAAAVAGREIRDQPPLGRHLGGGLLQQRVDIVGFGEIAFVTLQDAVSHGAVDTLHPVNGLASFQCLPSREAGFEHSPRQTQHVLDKHWEWTIHNRFDSDMMSSKLEGQWMIWMAQWIAPKRGRSQTSVLIPRPDLR